MRRILLLILSLILSITTAIKITAQDVGFESRNPFVPNLGNLGVTGASPRTGLLNTTINDALKLQPNGLPTFNVVDVAMGDFNADGKVDIIAVSADDLDGNGKPDSGRLTVLAGFNDGTFSYPISKATQGLPTAITVADIDLDGFADVGVAEEGLVEVFTGFFLTTGKPSFDRFGERALRTSNRAISISFARLDGDPLADIVVAEETGGVGRIEFFLTADNAGEFSASGAATNGFATTNRLIDSVDGSTITNPRVLRVATSNAASPFPDFDMDLYVSTTRGLEIYENNFPDFTLAATIAPDSVMPSYLIADINLDNRQDIVIADANKGTVTTFVATTTGYNAGLQVVETIPGVTGLTSINFTNDGRLDLALTVDSNDGRTSSIVILAGSGNGLFRQQTTLSSASGRSFFRSKMLATGRLDLGSPTDDILMAEPTSSFSPGGLLFLSAQDQYSPVFLQIISAVSPMMNLDNNGLNDLVLIEQNFGMLFILRNVTANGTPQVNTILLRDLFTNGALLPTSVTSFRNPLSNRTDLAVTVTGTIDGNTGGGMVLIANNDGSGNFSISRNFRQFVASEGATNLMSGDFNQDGSDDLCYIDYRSSFVTVMLNDGRNLFIDAQTRETGGFGPVSATLVDVNDDDYLDLAVVNQGSTIQGNQSLMTILIGQPDGTFAAARSQIQVPNFAISIVGGLANLDAGNTKRPIDFNNDGYPDLAVLSTRNAGTAQNVGTVTILLNRPDSPGDFNVLTPMPLVDNLSPAAPLQLEDTNGGPGIVSGRGGQNGFGAGFGGSNFLINAADFNADSFTDLVVSGTSVNNGINFRSSIYLLGGETNGQFRVARPQRAFEYGGQDPLKVGGDNFIGSAIGLLSSDANLLPEAVHISLNGRLWVDVNLTSLLNHAPTLTINRFDLNAPFPGGGRKYIVTAGEAAVIAVFAKDVDRDPLGFRLVSPPTGEQPPSFVTIQDNRDGSAFILVDTGDINRGPGNAVFRIGIEVADLSSSTGNRLPLAARDYFTLVVQPNAPPTLAAIANQQVQAGDSITIDLITSDDNSTRVSTRVACDKGEFVQLERGGALTIAPQLSDVGTVSCTVTAQDDFGLTASSQFTVTVVPNSTPPTINRIEDQVIQSGSTTKLPIFASDVNGSQLRLELVNSPAFVSLTDNGDGTGLIVLSPSSLDQPRSRAFVRVTTADGRSAQTSFEITVQNLVISSAQFKRDRLLIIGAGFGSGGAIVTVNGADVSDTIISNADSSLTLRGNKNRLKLKKGPNQIVVIANGATSNTFILTLGKKKN